MAAYYTNVVIVAKSYGTSKRRRTGNFCRRAKRPMTATEIDNLLVNNINAGFADRIIVYANGEVYAEWRR